jgi:hypothetical protein
MTTIRRLIEIPAATLLVAVAALVYLALCLGYAIAGFADWCREDL